MDQYKPETNGNLLRVEDLRTYFAIKKGLLRRTVGFIKAVDGVSLSIKAGGTLGLVGESGCGKTTVARSIIRLVPATAGKVFFEQKEILSIGKKRLRKLRSDISMIFQDPYGSLNPRMTVANIVGEPLKVHKGVTGTELSERIAALLFRVGLSAEHMNRYPHEFSGGQRQRIGVARALALGPKLVICDEPVSALDVSIQSQILNLLKDLQDEFGLTYLFIAHDLAVVEFACDVVAVMYMGKIVERASSRQLYRNPLHPYTRALMSAIPKLESASVSEGSAGRGAAGSGQGKRVPQGEVPSVLHPPSGCPFHPRCPLAKGRCLESMPQLEEKDDGTEHFVACWKR
ncbi:MAG: ATP-binding cassette domain-containing protein [Sedimentisphaerales bacterium]|nr:ATP-binding cassette domain-containing protein [Sedimentisphaerales bacterium]